MYNKCTKSLGIVISFIFINFIFTKINRIKVDLTKRKSYVFKTFMVLGDDEQVVEMIKWGFGFQMKCVKENDTMKFLFNEYVIKIGSRIYPVRYNWLTYIGVPYTEKKDLDENRFEMTIKFINPWLGTLYDYNGSFEIKEKK